MVEQIFGQSSEIHKHMFDGAIMDESKNLEWILTPQKVFLKSVLPMNIKARADAFDEIEKNYTERSEWIF